MATLRIKNQGSGPRFYARWRDGKRAVERQLGPAWMVPVGDGAAKANGKSLGPWVERSGRAKDGFLTLTTATQAMPAAQDVWAEREVLDPVAAEAARLRARARALEDEARRVEGDQAITFRDAAERWYEYRRDVKRLRTSTLRDYRRALDARILPVLGDVPLLQLDESDVVAFRDALARERAPKSQRAALTPATINKYLVVIDGVLGQACKKSSNGGFDLPSNPADEVEKIADRKVDDTRYLTASEIVSVAAALEAGRHRDVQMPAGGAHALEVHALGRAADDARDAAAVIVAGFAGLRRGEVVGLRWLDVSLTDARFRVSRAIVDGEVVTPKGKRARDVPMADVAANALAKLDRARRAHAVAAGIPPALGDDAPVFGSALGEPLDPVALTQRYRKACRAIGLREVRWHGLRHSFTTIAREGFSADQVQRIVGHEDAATAQRYSHPRSRSTDAALLSATIAKELEATAKRVAP